MDTWQAAEWIAFWAVIVAIVLAAFTIWATRKWGNRRGKLLFASTSTRLLTEGTASGHLEVTYRDIPVAEPHLVTLLLKNLGPNDITRDHFHDEQPLRIGLGSTFYGVIRRDSSTGKLPTLVMGGIGDPEAVIGFQPTHLPKGGELVVELLVSGPAVPEVIDRLVNTDIAKGKANNIVLEALVEMTPQLMPWPFSSVTNFLLTRLQS